MAAPVLGIMAFAASFFFLATPKLGGTAVRVGISDVFLVVFLGLCAMQWRRIIDVMRHQCSVLFFMSAMAFVMVLGFLRGPDRGDPARSWALVKLTGFVILVLYSVAGSALVIRFRSEGTGWFCKAFIWTGWAVALYALLRYTLAYWEIYPDFYYPRMAGFAQNPNAFGILLSAVLVLQLVFADRGKLFSPRIHTIGSALLLIDIFLSASRSAYLAVFFGLAALAMRKRLSLRMMAHSVAMALVALVAIFGAPRIAYRVPAFIGSIIKSARTGTTIAPAASPETGSAPASSPGAGRGAPLAVTREQADVGVTARIHLLRDSIVLWRSNPALGAGLGSFLQYQAHMHPNDPDSIYTNHNSALWLLSEMGLLGLGVFAGFFIFCAAVLYRKAGSSVMVAGVFGILIAMGGASVGTEILYQRYLWLFLGIGLAEALAHGNSSKEVTQSCKDRKYTPPQQPFSGPTEHRSSGKRNTDMRTFMNDSIHPATSSRLAVIP